MLLRRERKARVRHLGGAESAGRFCCDQQVQSSVRADGCALLGEFGDDGEGIENGCSVEESESIVVELLGGRVTVCRRAFRVSHGSGRCRGTV